MYFVGRLGYRRGVDCANFLTPLFFGACVWEVIGTHPELSKNLSCIKCWAPLTYIVFIGFMVFIFALFSFQGAEGRGAKGEGGARGAKGQRRLINFFATRFARRCRY